MRLRPVRLAVAVVLLLASPGLAWNKGQSGNGYELDAEQQSWAEL